MKPTHCVFQSSRYPCVWGKVPDFDPPPGRELAQAVLDEMKILLPEEPAGRTVGGRDWEHSLWIFCVRWEDRVYQFEIEASAKDTDPPTWHLGITRVRGLLRAVFGFRKTRFDVDDRFLALAAQAVHTVAGGGDALVWITEDEAISTLWPARAGNALDDESD